MMSAAVAVFVFVMMIVVVTVVVIAVGIALLGQLTSQQRENLFFNSARRTGKDLNSCCPQAVDCSAAYSTTNEGVDPLADQKAYQCAVPFSWGSNDAFFDDFAFFGCDNVKLRCATKMGENLCMLGCNCNFH